MVQQISALKINTAIHCHVLPADTCTDTDLQNEAPNAVTAAIKYTVGNITQAAVSKMHVYITLHDAAHSPSV